MPMEKQLGYVKRSNFSDFYRLCRKAERRQEVQGEETMTKASGVVIQPREPPKLPVVGLSFFLFTVLQIESVIERL
jgi:hypothetical protein